MRSAAGIVRVAAFCFGSVLTCVVGPSCAEQLTLVDDTGTVEYGGHCPRCNQWVQGSPAGWAAGFHWCWHGYLATCAKCGADLFAEMGDVQVEGRFRIIQWRASEADLIIAVGPPDDSSP